MSQTAEIDYYSTHVIGMVDDCIRCINCEIGSWNAHKRPCPANERKV